MALTADEYSNFEGAFAFFNQELFNSKLPPCLITLQRKPGSPGYYSPYGFNSRIHQGYADEIALNPDYFVDHADEEILSVLVHQMVHQYQRVYGTPGRGGYHNREWATLMIERGLIPVSEKPGGGQTGDKVSHYIKPGGKFQTVYKKLLATDFKLRWAPRDTRRSPTDQEGDSPGGDRRKFTCPECNQNVWAKPSARIICGVCHEGDNMIHS